ncbi:unnamed protein product [Closterium sp. NIES-54]
MSSSHCTSSTSAATRRSRASPSRSDGTPLPLNSNRTLEIHLSAAAAGHDGAYCGVTTCTSDVTVASAATDVATPSCRSPTTILDFPASPSVSAFPHAAFPMSPCADSIPWSSNSARFSLIDGEPFPAAAPCGSSAEAGAGTAAGNVALEDWLNEAAASMVETCLAPMVLGRKQRRRLMRQWFHDAPHGLFP